MCCVAELFASYKPSGSNCDGFVAGVAAMINQINWTAQAETIDVRLSVSEAG